MPSPTPERDEAARATDRYRDLPQMHRLLESKTAQRMLASHSRERVTEALRKALDAHRAFIASNPRATVPGDIALLVEAEAFLESTGAPSLCPVINATGIVLHTNLGRAPLSAEALDAIVTVAGGYSTLEWNAETGKRGSRVEHVAARLCRLTGAEAALVVNNNAAAVLLALNTLARSGEVITSRGELVEIGGSFRIPDVIESGEATLREVGTTNKTRAADFEKAITPHTRALLIVHPSNYRIVGFTESAPRADLVAIARAHTIPTIEDVGSGCLVDLSQYGLPKETTMAECVAAGVDVVTFSGDKMLGGPQAGIVVGKKALLDRMKQNPLYRAVRCDKLSLAALEATLRLYDRPDALAERLPVFRMLAQPQARLRERAQYVLDELQGCPGIDAITTASESYSGGGSLPDEALPSVAVQISSGKFAPDALAAALRGESPPVVGRVYQGRWQADMRTLTDDDATALVNSLRRLHQ